MLEKTTEFKGSWRPIAVLTKYFQSIGKWTCTRNNSTRRHKYTQQNLDNPLLDPSRQKGTLLPFERVAPLLLALVLFWLRLFWGVAPLCIDLHGEIQQDVKSPIIVKKFTRRCRNALWRRKASLLLCEEELCVWIVEFGLSEAHCGGFSKSCNNSYFKARRHPLPFIWCEKRRWVVCQLIPCRWIWTTFHDTRGKSKCRRPNKGPWETSTERVSHVKQSTKNLRLD